MDLAEMRAMHVALSWHLTTILASHEIRWSTSQGSVEVTQEEKERKQERDTVSGKSKNIAKAKRARTLRPKSCCSGGPNLLTWVQRMQTAMCYGQIEKGILCFDANFLVFPFPAAELAWHCRFRPATTSITTRARAQWNNGRRVTTRHKTRLKSVLFFVPTHECFLCIYSKCNFV